MKHVCSAEKVLKQALQEKIDWYDYEQLDQRGLEEYYKDAQTILNNNTFNNEMKHAMAELVDFIATKAETIEQVRDARMTINGMKLMQERLMSIKNPNKKVNAEDLYSAL